jgi:hypothetical protein
MEKLPSGKTQNITVRVNPDLKDKAQLACDYLGTSLTFVVNSALRKVINEYEEQQTKNLSYAKLRCRGSVAIAALEALEQITQLNNGIRKNVTLRPEVEKLLLDWTEE